ncbi:TonB-dependent receptor [Spirosoma utsteinense]|uniref:Outer membrane cobalamin receptor n=1 Tax=Spirosoma utsteinense TaxID=2585773 RepID=A0ABR6W0S4_9BACT|nr:TonB-dependent receptor [Spirosoma utsteinense]MBC3784516.1 outer membrane cobalamin receptor [Spirosoma utsteinense]MBC3789733.1 outer membrane cobalamin receptor [Spirosoma utsteinense]
MRFISLWILLLLLTAGFNQSVLGQSDSSSIKSSADSVTNVNTTVRGRISETLHGKPAPLTGATVLWLGTSAGTVTDSIGSFQLATHPSVNQLVISYVGYQADTLLVIDPTVTLNVTLRAERTLQEVTVSGAPGQIDRINPIQTELITQRTLAKAACCNLSESFETNASVSVSYADAVTGARQIQFLGLGGQYVQTNVENIPTVRGLGTTFGLNYIPGTWITSIDVGKGAGSVVNGYESMSGQMNIELQKPDSPDKLFVNGYVNSFGRVEGNLNWSQPINKKWSVGVLGHASTLQKETDQNKDGFRDLPLYTQINAINRYKYNGERFMAQFGVKALYEDRNGGQLSRFGPSRYRFGNTTKRLEFFSKTARLYPDQPYKGLGLILNGLNHEQTALFGFKPYAGRQRTIYANLIYQNIIGSTNHTYKAGLSYLLDDYREQLGTLQTNRTESVPGVFAEYTYTYPEKMTVVLGGRFDYHNLFGPQWTPRAHLKYDLSPNLTLRASAGRGFRVPNFLAENFGYLVSSRVVINEAQLRPEVSWNYGGSLTNDFTLFGKKASLVLDYHRTDFREQLFVDIEHPREIHFHNLYGKSFANSFQAELNYQPIRRMDVKLAYRLFDVRQSMSVPSEDTLLLPRMMIPRDRFLLNVGYALPFDKWKFDATLQWNGPRRIPYLRAGTGADYTVVPLEYSPGYYNLNAQVSRAFVSGWEIYIGGENLTGFRQQTPIVAANDPFGADFDAGSRVWGPVTGRMVYVGFRFKPIR